jgi:hypothetical protein
VGSKLATWYFETLNLRQKAEYSGDPAKREPQTPPAQNFQYPLTALLSKNKMHAISGREN